MAEQSRFHVSLYPSARKTTGAQNSWLALFCCALSLTFGCFDRSDTGRNPAEGSKIVLTPSVLPADGISQAQVDIWLRDGDGAALSNVPVTLVSSGPAAITQPTAPTDSHGHALGFVSSEVSGKITLGVQATLNRLAVIAPATAQLELVVASALRGNQLSVDITPPSGSVDVATRRSVQVRLKSAAGISVPNSQISLTVGRAGDTLSPAQGVTDGNGEFQSTLTSTRSGIAQLSVSAPGASNASATTTFLAGAPDAAHTYFLTQIGNEVPSDGQTTPASVFVGDQYGNPVSFASVTLAVSGQNIVLVPPVGVADSQGVFHTTISSLDLGSAAVVINTGTTLSQQNIQLVVGPASASNSSLSVSPSNLTANGVSQGNIFVTLADAAGHPRVADTVTFFSSDTASVLSPNLVLSDSTGVAQSRVVSTHAGNVTLVAQAGNLSLSAPVTFVPGPPAAKASSLSVTPNSSTASISANISVTAVLCDAQGNPTPNVSLSWSSSDSSVTFSSQTSATDAAGQARVAVSSTMAGTWSLCAQVANTLSSCSNFTIWPAAPNATCSSINMTPNTQIVAGTSAMVQVQFRDAFANPISGSQPAFAGGQNIVLQSGFLATDANGYSGATFYSTLAQTTQVFAVLQNVALCANYCNVAAQPASNFSSLSLSSNTALADGDSAVAIVAQFADIYGNPASGQNYSISSLMQRSVSSRYAVGYGNNNSGDANARLTVNGILLPNAIYYPYTNAWSNWTFSPTQSIPLQSGNNNMMVRDIINPVNYDYFLVSSGDQNEVFEAEAATIGGNASIGNIQTDSWSGGYFGTGYVSFPQSGNSTVSTQLFSASGAANALISLRIYSPVNTFGVLPVSVNGSSVGSIYVSWGSVVAWANSSAVRAPFIPGNNTILVQGSNQPIYIDQIIVNLRGPSQLIEAESGVFAGGAFSEARWEPFSGSGYAGGLSDQTKSVTETISIGSELGLPSDSVLDGNGRAYVTWSSQIAEIKQLVATSGSVTFSSNATFLAGPVSPNTSFFAVSSPNVVVGTVASIGVAAKDQFSNPASSVGVNFYSSDSNVSILNPNVMTDSDGLASTTLQSSVVGTHQLCAQIGGAFALCQNTQVVSGNTNSAP